MNHCDKPGLMPVEVALERLLQTVEVTTATETLPLAGSLGRVLAQDVV
ncbi:MAG TPA: molybdopterin molybdenumtransferase MoeA, partial [Gammaproteobacteria bacterium]|nr:molybdopterin molybdenumtransferase MoeA [Gammaproteobacteria bacterium]